MYEKRYPVAIEVEGLRKRFRSNEAVRGLNLTVATGTIYGLLGPNGAGKTTTVRMLTTLLRPDSGRAAVLGHDVVREAAAVRRRLDLAASFIVPADLYFLDEPTTGLDPAARAQVWQIVRSAAESGSTVLLTTQYLEEADHLADRVAVIDHGTVVAEGTPAELKADTGKGTLDEVFLELTRDAVGGAA